jgi:hypothetical protein
MVKVKQFRVSDAPSELEAIQNLRLLLLGEAPPLPIPINPPPPVPPAPTPVHEEIDNRPIHIWDPRTVPTLPTLATTSPLSPSPGPNLIITSDSDNVTKDTNHAVPTLSQTHRTVNFTRSMARHTHSNHIHLINSAISEALLPHHNVNVPTTFPPHGYIATTRALLVQTYGITSSTPTTTDDCCFIGAIIDDVTGDVLEYRHLIKNTK